MTSFTDMIDGLIGDAVKLFTDEKGRELIIDLQNIKLCAQMREFGYSQKEIMKEMRQY